MSKQRQDPLGKRAETDGRDIFDKALEGVEKYGIAGGALLGAALGGRYLGRQTFKIGGKNIHVRDWTNTAVGAVPGAYFGAQGGALATGAAYNARKNRQRRKK